MGNKDIAFEIVVNPGLGTLRGRNADAARRWWKPIGQLQEETAAVALDCGLTAAMAASVREVVFELRYTDRFGVIAEDSCFEGRERKTVRVALQADGSRLAEDPSNAERYWRLKHLLIEALCWIAARVSADSSVHDKLAKEMHALPASSPWPPLPEHSGEETSSREEDAASDIRSLPEGPGVLWVMVRHDSIWSEAETHQALSALRDFAVEGGHGSWDGDSQDRAQADISFAVEHMRESARALDSFVRSQWPGVTFIISDDYLPSRLERGA